MKQSNTKTKIIAAAVAVFILIAGYAYLYFDFVRTNDSISADSAAISQEATQEQQVIGLRQTVASLQKDQGLLDSLFVDNDKVADFIQSIESLADTAGVSHQLSINVQPDDSLAADNKELLQFHMTTSGSWTNTIRFMTLLENMPYKVYVGSVELGEGSDQVSGVSGSPQKSSGSWKGDFDFSVVKNK